MRLVDADDLKEHIIQLILVYKGVRLENAIIEAIDNAPTIRWTDKLFLDNEGNIRDFNNNKLDYKVIHRGKCVLCGKELTEGLFFCKDYSCLESITKNYHKS